MKLEWPWIAGIGSMVALLAAGWRQALMVFNYLSDMVFCRVTLDGEVRTAMVAYLWQQGRRSPFCLRAFTGLKAYVNPVKRVEVVGFERTAEAPVLVFYGRVPVILSHAIDRRSTSPEGSGEVFIYFIRGTLKIEKVLVEALAYYNKLHRPSDSNKRHQRFFVRRMSGRDAHDSSTPSPASVRGKAEEVSESSAALKNLVMSNMVRLLRWQPQDIGFQQPADDAFNGYAFPPEIMTAVTEAKTWLAHEDWFKDKGIPWRRGWLLYGQTGCGKSTLVRALAMALDMPIFVLDLAMMDNATLADAWAAAQQYAPALVLIEDIDGVFDGRTNVAVSNKLRDGVTFDCLLNTISGVGTSDGIFLVLTTNDIRKLDAALGLPSSKGDSATTTRPGRIDRAIQLGLMQEQERWVVARHILGEFQPDVKDIVAEGEGMTAAQFQFKCAQTALDQFWQKHQAEGRLL